MKRMLPRVEREQAAKILRDVPADNAFNFYVDMGMPVGKSAKNLEEFANLIATIDEKSLEFHVLRGDFENWAILLGDQSLANQLTKLRKLRLSDGVLRERAYQILLGRYEQLKSSL